MVKKKEKKDLKKEQRNGKIIFINHMIVNLV